MRHLANLFTDKLIQRDIIKSDDRELYAYGFWQGAILIFNFITVLAIGLIFNMLFQSIMFMIFYGVLRPVAGGYHARTQHICYIFSILLLIIVLGLLYWFPWRPLWCFSILAVSVIIVFFLAPVEDENKPLDAMEQMVYKKRSRVISLVLSAIALISQILGQSKITNCISVSLLASAVMLILGKLKNANA